MNDMLNLMVTIDKLMEVGTSKAICSPRTQVLQIAFIHLFLYLLYHQLLLFKVHESLLNTHMRNLPTFPYTYFSCLVDC